MQIKVFSSLPQAAEEIRKKVFIEEQGFAYEFDEKDDIAAHLVLFDESGTPLATCRVFKDCRHDFYVLGRVAVLKEHRGKNLGLALLKEAENYVKEKGGNLIVLHAQLRAIDFYKKAGFTEFGEVEYDEGCAHIYMKKYLK